MRQKCEENVRHPVYSKEKDKKDFLFFLLAKKFNEGRCNLEMKKNVARWVLIREMQKIRDNERKSPLWNYCTFISVRHKP